MSRPSFPLAVAVSRRALRSAGSLRLGSPASSLHRRAPTPRRPSRRASLPSRPRYRRNSAVGDGEVSQVPRRPSRDACSGSSTPAEPREQDLRDRQSLRVAPPVLPSEPSVSSASTTLTFRGPIPQPAPSLSTLRGHGRPCASSTTTQDSLPAGGPALAGRDFYPQGHATRFRLVLGLHGFLLVEASLGAQKGVEAGDEERREGRRREGRRSGWRGAARRASARRASKRVARSARHGARPHNVSYAHLRLRSTVRILPP
jgi:hypothetical protein